MFRVIIYEFDSLGKDYTILHEETKTFNNIKDAKSYANWCCESGAKGYILNEIEGYEVKNEKIY